MDSVAIQYEDDAPSNLESHLAVKADNDGNLIARGTVGHADTGVEMEAIGVGLCIDDIA